MKTLLAAMVVSFFCAACAQGGASASGPGTGKIDMYGTIDEGITVHN